MSEKEDPVLAKIAKSVEEGGTSKASWELVTNTDGVKIWKGESNDPGIDPDLADEIAQAIIARARAKEGV